MNYQQALKDFHEKYSHHISEYPERAPYQTADLRIKLINEEVNQELIPVITKLLKLDLHEDEDIRLEKEYLIELADAIADSLYVIFGTAISYGIDIDKVFKEVHRSNMSKSIMKNEYGKTIKGKEFSPVNLRNILFSE